MQYVEEVNKGGLGLMNDFEQGEQGQEGKGSSPRTTSFELAAQQRNQSREQLK